MTKLPLILASSAALALAACGDANDTDTVVVEDTAADQTATTSDASDAGSVVDVAQSDARFSTLVSAISAADLADTLGGAGPFTVFAPNNAAFDKLPAEARVELLGDAGMDGTTGTATGGQEAARSGGQVGRQAGMEAEGDSEALAEILRYHVVEGRVDAQTLTNAVEQAGERGYAIETLGGGRLIAKQVGEGISLTDEAGNTSMIVTTDIAGSNGLVHEIDTVLMPE